MLCSLLVVSCVTSGVVAYVSNGGFVEANTADGLRKCLVDEFSNIYVFHLRGNARTAGELRRKERDNVFGMGTRTPVAISVLVKNPNTAKNGQVHFYDIGDYLTREQKLEKIVNFASIKGITDAGLWNAITPDVHNDWIGQRDNSFEKFISIGDKKDVSAITVFDNYSRGIATSRDTWCYNYSQSSLKSIMCSMVDFYNSEVERYKNACEGLPKPSWPEIDEFINTDSSKISWNRGLKNDLGRHIQHPFEHTALTIGLYRPFTKQHVYFHKHYNDMVYQMPKLFPLGKPNLVIYVSGAGNGGKPFSALITDVLPDLNLQHSGGQGFPLWLHEAQTDEKTDLFSQEKSRLNATEATSALNADAIKFFTDAYSNHTLALFLNC